MMITYMTRIVSFDLPYLTSQLYLMSGFVYFELGMMHTYPSAGLSDEVIGSASISNSCKSTGAGTAHHVQYTS